MRPEISQVLELIRRDDPQSLEEALALLQNTVLSFSMKVCGQKQDAEDTTQEVLLQSLAKLSQFDNAQALVVWLYKVAKTRCLMSRRKSKFSPKQALSLEALMPDKKELAGLSHKTPEDPETAMVRRENARRLRDAVQKLPPEYRLVLVLRDMEELSDGDVAEITGLKPGTVRVRLHRARLFVRKELERSAAVKKLAGLRAAAREPKRERSCKQMFAQLSDYLDEELDDSLCDELEKHMHGCEPCQAFLVSLQRSIERCRLTPAEGMDPKQAAELRRTVLARYQAALSHKSATSSN